MSVTDLCSGAAEILLNAAENRQKVPCSERFTRNNGTFPDLLGTAETRAPLGFQDFVPSVPGVPSDFEDLGKGHSKKSIYMEYLDEPGGDGGEAVAPSMKVPTVATCQTCTHRRMPGLSAGYCAGRDDLPHVYTAGHPLRILPDDLGGTCGAWERHPFEEG